MRPWVPIVIAASVSAGVFGASAWHAGSSQEAGSSQPGTLERCLLVPAAEEVSCFSEQVVSAYHDNSLEAAAELMEDLAASPLSAARFAARCHDVAHALGEAIDLENETGLESRGPRVCRSGFFHGVHFQRFDAYPSPEQLAAAAPVVCVGSEDIVRVGTGGVGNGCRHALGHELILRGYDPSLSALACTQPAEATHNPESAVEDCLHGVYMQVFLGFEAEEVPGDPVQVCTPSRSVGRGAQLACLGEAGPSLFRIGEDPRSGVDPFALCARLAGGEVDLAASCSAGLGRSAAAYLENSRASLEGYCRRGVDLYEPCLVGAATAVAEAEQDHTWVEVCYGLEMEQECVRRMNDIMVLVGTRS